MDTLTRPEESNSFGYWLRRHRKALDWTQAELARRVNCAAATIRKIEADERKPSRQLAEALADQLNVPADQRAAFLHAARHAVFSDASSFATPALISARPPHNLPTPLTALVNRVRDIAAISAMLTRDDVRLLTLIGSPGIGKTRLCLQSAGNVLTHFPDGVWYVDLAPVADSALVLLAIARALNIAESGALMPMQQLTVVFKDQRALLVLDNFEQVADAARDVTELLRACRGLKVLATSRVPLHAYGEHEYAVLPMSLPPRDTAPNQLIEYEAVQLFAARVREHQPGFAIAAANARHVAEVCIHLDGVPLALELAAASLRRMTLAELAALLTGEPHWLRSLHSPAQDLPPRQRTLYNAIAWSYSLLDATTQTGFRRLGVFVGGFDELAAATICAADASILATLTDHSLLAREPAHWQMLEMIREFALEQMSLEEHAAVEQRHVTYFAERLRKFSVNTPELFERDHGNFRAALRWAIHARDGLLALTMCHALTEFWETHGYLREGLVFTRQVLAIAENVEPRLRIDFLGSAGHLAWNRHEFAAALELTEQGIALARMSGLEDRLPVKFNIQARIFIEQGDYARAEETLRECVGLAQEYHNTSHLGIAWAQRGEVALACGRLDDAQLSSEQALPLLKEQTRRFIAMARTNLAEVALARGDYITAREELRRALPHIHTHVRRELCFVATLAGWLVSPPHVTKEDVRRGAALFGAVERLVERTGAPLSAMYRELGEKRVEIARRRLTAREWQEAWNIGRAWAPEQVNAQVESLLNSEPN
jgi:predicted ATPase/transcriptional regulator with XRE-family HTH domain